MNLQSCQNAIRIPAIGGNEPLAKHSDSQYRAAGEPSRIRFFQGGLPAKRDQVGSRQGLSILRGSKTVRKNGFQVVMKGWPKAGDNRLPRASSLAELHFNSTEKCRKQTLLSDRQCSHGLTSITVRVPVSRFKPNSKCMKAPQFSRGEGDSSLLPLQNSVFRDHQLVRAGECRTLDPECITDECSVKA